MFPSSSRQSLSGLLLLKRMAWVLRVSVGLAHHDRSYETGNSPTSRSVMRGCIAIWLSTLRWRDWSMCNGDPVLLAFAVEEIKDNCARAHRPRICDTVVEACRWRHLYLPADINFPNRHDRRPRGLAFSDPHYSRLPNEGNQARLSKLICVSSSEGRRDRQNQIKASAEEKGIS